MQPKEVVPLGIFWSEWSRCLTATYQRDQLYRFGKLDDCSKQWQDVKTALSAKFVKDDQEAQDMIQKTHYMKRTTVSPTAGVIWELKETPGWDL
jgi:uridine kinase